MGILPAQLHISATTEDSRRLLGLNSRIAGARRGGKIRAEMARWVVLSRGTEPCCSAEFRFLLCCFGKR